MREQVFVDSLYFETFVSSDTGGISTPLQQLCMVDRPDEDASAAEIARWMEEDFSEALAEGIEQANEEDENDE